MVNARRSFLKTSVGFGAAAVLGWPRLPSLLGGVLALHPTLSADDGFAGGKRLEILPFLGRDLRLEVLYNHSRDRRFRQDLSLLTPETLITPVERFYVRSGVADEIDYEHPWKIRVDGLVRESLDIPIEALTSIARPMGVHLMECNGSGLGGLISAARWTGIPARQVLAKAKFLSQATHVKITGFMQWSKRNPESGELLASWVFSFKQLDDAGAFFATGMNGKPLTKDHGYPIRLVMPGWYGCSCIKWVNSIRLLDDSARSTVQMLSYADLRKDRSARFKLAKDLPPKNIDVQAMPVRVEKWRLRGKIVYRVVGIIWGGRQTTDKLAIRFNRDEEYVPVESCRQKTHQTWTLWSHTWRPARTGRYRIRLKVLDLAVPTRRLDRGYYECRVRVKEV